MASPGEPALCQLYRHTFVCYKLALTRQGAGRTETKSHVVDCLVLVFSISQVVGCEDRLQNDLYCVEWGVKLYPNQRALFSSD